MLHKTTRQDTHIYTISFLHNCDIIETRKRTISRLNSLRTVTSFATGKKNDVNIFPFIRMIISWRRFDDYSTTSHLRPFPALAPRFESITVMIDRGFSSASSFLSAGASVSGYRIIFFGTFININLVLGVWTAYDILRVISVFHDYCWDVNMLKDVFRVNDETQLRKKTTENLK